MKTAIYSELSDDQLTSHAQSAPALAADTPHTTASCRKESLALGHTQSKATHFSAANRQLKELKASVGD